MTTSKSWTPTKSQIASWLNDPELIAWIDQHWSIFPDAPASQPILEELIRNLQNDPQHDWRVFPGTNQNFTIGVDVLRWEVWFAIATPHLFRILDWHKKLKDEVSSRNSEQN